MDRGTVGESEDVAGVKGFEVGRRVDDGGREMMRRNGQRIS